LYSAPAVDALLCPSGMEAWRLRLHARAEASGSPFKLWPPPSHHPPGSRNEPGLRPERQSLTGKGGKVSERRSAQAAPRRPRAPAPQEASGRRRGALECPKPYPPLAAAQPGSRNGPDSRPKRQPLTGRGGKVSGRRSAQAAPRRSRAPGAAGSQWSTSQRPLQRLSPFPPNPPPASPPQSEDLAACPPARALGGRRVVLKSVGRAWVFGRASGAPPRPSVPFGRPPFFLTGRARAAR
jgi:hypothetical protein